MKISAVRATRVRIPLSVPYKLSKVYGTKAEADAVVLRVETDEGVVGYGEADPHTPFTADTPGGVMAALHDYLGPALLGRDPRDPGAVEWALDGLLLGDRMAKGAVSMALHDLAGKAAGLPVHRLLGGAVRRSLPVMWPLGSGTAEEDGEIIAARQAEGYTTFMAKMGRNPVGADIARVHALYAAHGDTLGLVADANRGWRVEEAVRFVDAVRGTGLLLLEQPVAARDVQGLARVRRMATCAISADEGCTDAEDALALVQHDAVDVLSLKVSKNGGLGRTGRIAAVARAAHRQCLMNSMLEFGITQAASLHLGATLPHLVDFGHAYMSVLRMSDDFTDFARLVDGGTVRVPETPGLGVAVDEDKLARLALETFIVA